MKSNISVLFLLIFIASCSSQSTPIALFSIHPTLAQGFKSEPTLRDLAMAHNLLVGTAVNMNPLLWDAQYGKTLASQFNLVTPEHVMKFAATEPAQGVYSFAQADALVAFAKAHTMQVHGHNLVWHTALPSWLAHTTFTRNQLLAILKDHIFKVVSHYLGQVSMWDVVNEAVADNGQLRDSLWLRTIGPDYIDWAFRWAHQADPQAHLFYNDYGGEESGAKSDAIFHLVKGMLQRGIPIYGVGLEMHLSSTHPLVQQLVVQNMQRLAALGLKVQITELDVRLQKDPRPLSQKLQAQAQIYSSMLGACLQVFACEAFSMWGFTDRYTWIPDLTGNPDEPLIFDTNYHPKPAYDALVHTLQGF
ncbi:MAG: endo-1,4-beta-xylanase [Chloroflexi bacterium]|nr:endo-1,4-beta-xylanase [Chloroflexota bacterium]